MKTIIFLLGLGIIIIGLLYSKKHHEKFFLTSYSSSSSSSSVNDSLIIGAFYFLIGFILSISPWYIVKIILLLLGILFIGLSLFYM